ncbi:MAG: HAMP domain-containing protein [Chloroflexi bacterium]|nr:HAMP domain-containing protein [Chloroflexota bacterium]
MNKSWLRLGEWGLWPRMALAISLGFLALFAAFGVLGERALQDSTDRLLEERLAITQLVADQIDGLLEEAILELKLANTLITLDDGNRDLSAAAEILAQTYGRVGLFSTGLVLLDNTGAVVLTNPANLYQEGTDLSRHPYVQDVLNGQESTVADPFLHPVSEQPITAVTVPLIQNNQLAGLLSGFMSLDGQGVILPLNRAAIVGQAEHAILVDSDGRTLASTFDLPFLSPGEHETFYRETMISGTPAIDTTPFELELPNEPKGHLHVMAFVPLQNAPWGLAVGGDASGDTFASIEQLRLGLVVLSVVSLSFIWIITLVGTKRLVKPVQSLTESAHQIAGGDLKVPLETTDGGEIGVMASAINEMRNQLLQNIDQLSDWNETLELRVTEQTEHLNKQQQLTQQLLKQVINAQEGERRRIAYELHDEIGQMLTAVEMSLQHLSKGVSSDDVLVNTRLARSRNLTEKTVVDLRRIIAALRPTVLDQLGLLPALDWICDQTLRPNEVDVTISAHNMDERLPGEIETILFRIAQEAVNNIARHSQAHHVSMTLSRSSTNVTLSVEDDGRGFDPSTVPDMPTNGKGLGLAGIRERALLAGGNAEIRSVIGEGTAVHVTIPLTQQKQAGETNAKSTD